MSVKKTNTKIELDYPVMRGETVIDKIEVRRPSAGQLRGIYLVDLMQMDTDALTKVLPRITSPTLTEDEIKKLDPADLVALGVEVLSFLASKRSKAEAEATLIA